MILSDGNGAVSAETIDVNVETGSDGVVPGDGLSMLDRVVVDNLTARPWSMDNGRSGVTLSATAVRAVIDSHAAPGTPPTPAAESASEAPRSADSGRSDPRNDRCLAGDGLHRIDRQADH